MKFLNALNLRNGHKHQANVPMGTCAASATLTRFRWLPLIICLLMVLAQPALAAEEYVCFGEEECKFELDRIQLKINIAKRITYSLLAKGVFKAPIPPENVKILKTVPFQIGDLQLFAVKVDILPVEKGQKGGVNFVVVDKSGTRNVRVLEDLASGRNLSFEALVKVKTEVLPEGLGRPIAKGRGNLNVVFVSEPLCSYCQEAFKFFEKNMNRIKTVSLVYYPLEGHMGSDTACELMEYAYLHDLSPEEVVKFAFTELKSVEPVGENEALVKHMKLGILKQFLAKFPKIKEKLGDDMDKALATLEKETKERIDKDVAQAEGLGINSTPVVFVDGIRMSGFKGQDVEAIFNKGMVQKQEELKN